MGGQKAESWQQTLNPGPPDAWSLRAHPFLYLGFLKHQVRRQRVTTCFIIPKYLKIQIRISVRFSQKR